MSSQKSTMSSMSRTTMKTLCRQISAVCLALLLVSPATLSTPLKPVRRVHKTIGDNMMAAALISSATALGHKQRPSAAAIASSAIADVALGTLAQSVASSLASSASDISDSSSAESAVVSAVAAAALPSLLPAMPSMVSILQNAALAASSAVAAATPTRLSPLEPGISQRQRMMRQIAKEAFAYMAAPLFMPVAFGRVLFQPNGLPQDQAVLRRFGRFLAARFRPNARPSEAQKLNDGFLNMITKNRKNILLTMKQFRDVTRKANQISAAAAVAGKL